MHGMETLIKFLKLYWVARHWRIQDEGGVEGVGERKVKVLTRIKVRYLIVKE